MNLIPGKLYEISNDINTIRFGPHNFEKYIKKGSIVMLTTISQPSKVGLFTIIKLGILHNNEIYVFELFNKNLKYYLKEI